MSNELTACLTRFAERWNLGELTTDTLGRYRLEIDGRLTVTVFQTGRHILIESPLGRLPEDARQADESLLAWLTTRLGELRTREEVLTLDPENADLILFRRLPAATLTLETLEQALESFANQLDDWTRRVSRAPTPITAMPLHILFP